MADVLVNPGVAVSNQEVIEDGSFLEQCSDRLRQAAAFAGNVVSSAFVALEVNPITNEAARFAAFGAAQAAFESPYAAAGAFTAATFAIEAAGSAATAKLLDTESGHYLTERVNDVLDRMKLSNLLKTNVATEAAVSMIAGAPAATVLKHRQDPERSFADNLRYGLVSSAGIAAVSGGESLLVAQSINHPNPLTIGAAALGMGLIVGGARWVKSRFAHTTEGTFIEGELVEAAKTDPEQLEPLSYDAYRAMMDAAAVGPQVEGYNELDYEGVMADERTRAIGLEVADGGQQAWPALSPITNSTEYMPGYFARHYEDGTPVYYLSLPPDEIIASQPEFSQQLAAEILRLSNEGAVVVYDERVSQHTDVYLRDILAAQRPDATVTIDNFIDPHNNTPAATVHYAATFTAAEGLGHQERTLDTTEDFAATIWKAYDSMIASGELKSDGSITALLVRPEELDQPYGDGSQTLMERLWDIYKDRFGWLIENNPSRGAQTLEELRTMLHHPGTLTAVYTENDQVRAFTKFITKTEAADWLRPEFYDQNFPGERTVYFPGIASDGKATGGHASIALASMITKVFANTVDKVRVVWQCTNVSAGYIPRIVSIGVNSAGVGHLETPVETERYNYRGMRVTLPELVEA